MHNFINYNKIPKYISDDFALGVILLYKKCLKCNIEIVQIANDQYNYADFMYLNNIEVFQNVYSFERLKLTCSEIIIKSLIE